MPFGGGAILGGGKDFGKIPFNFDGKIILTNGDSYWPGDKIEGYVHIENPTDIFTRVYFRGFSLGFSGQEKVQFKETGSLKDFHTEKIHLFGPEPCPGSVRPSSTIIPGGPIKKLPAGSYQFPFEFDITSNPEQFPCSFSHPNAFIKYTLTLYVKMTFEIVKTEKIIKIYKPSEKLLKDPSLQKPLIYKAGRSSFKYIFKLEKKILVTGQDLSFTLEIYNSTSAKACISLIQRFHLKTTMDNKIIKKKIWSVQNHNFEVYWTDYLKIPADIPPTHFGYPKSTGNMNVLYFIKIEIESNEGDCISAEIPMKMTSPLKKDAVISKNNANSDIPQTQRRSSCIGITPTVKIHEPLPGPSYRHHAGDTLEPPPYSMGNFFGGINSIANCLPAYSELSLLSTTETLPPSFDELSDKFRRLSF